MRSGDGTPASAGSAKLIEHTSAGDAYFSAGRYLEAINSYATAIESSPLDSEGMFRLGHALVAAGQYETALRAFKSAMSLSTDIDRDRFDLDGLYGSSGEKAVHLEALAKYANEKTSADALFLLGVFLVHLLGGSNQWVDVHFDAGLWDPNAPSIDGRDG